MAHSIERDAAPATRAVWAVGLLTLALLVGLGVYLSPLEPGVLALQFAFTPRAFAHVIHIWSPEDLLCYRRHLAVDYFLLLAYGAFGYLLVTRTQLFDLTRQSLRHAASWLLPIAALFDALENAVHGWLTEVPRFGVPLVYAASASFSCLKWGLIVGFILVVTYALSRDEA